MKNFLLASMLLIVGCGTDVVKVKRYKLAVTRGDHVYDSTFRALVNDFNAAAGLNVLFFESDVGKANSAIMVVKDLSKKEVNGVDDGIVGLGQYVITTAGDQSRHRIQFYSMNVVFDWDYLNQDYSTQEGAYNLRKLFYHEVGHGLELEHNEANKHDVMYPNIDGTKDFDEYFKYVRRYVTN